MSISSHALSYINAGITIMPTNLEVMKKTLEKYQLDISDFRVGNFSSRAFQGSVSISDAQSAVTVSFLTNEKQIEEMLPPGKNLTVSGPPMVTVSAIYQGGLKWLAGRSYNLIIVMLPVVHNGKNGQTFGQYLPVVWENMTEPILMGRETLGWPKIYADLPEARKLGDTWECIASWDGFTFLDINVKDVRALTPEEIKAKSEAASNAKPSAGLICHKFIFKTGSRTETDADYLTIATNEGAPEATVREVLTGKADIRFNEGSFEQLPTMVHILEKLATLEVKEVYDATIVTQTGGGMGITKILE